METTYTIEFMRLAEPPLVPIKHPSAFHVAYYCNLYYCNLCPTLNDSDEILTDHNLMSYEGLRVPGQRPNAP